VKAPDAYHAVTKLRALKRLNKRDPLSQALDDSLTKLAAWADAEPNSEQEARAFTAWLESPLPAFAYQ
jgi:hypothetical protein